MKNKIYLFFFVLLLLPENAYPWGAVERVIGVTRKICPTHQHIDEEAYKILKKDPAFWGSGFLPLKEILSQEGVTVRPENLDIDGFGPGPDSVDATNYSEHYFNPKINEGYAPKAVMEWFKFLAVPAGPQQYNKSKAAAWSAHYIADMGVPYHVVGMSRDTFRKLYKGNHVELDEKYTGPLILYSNCNQKISPPSGFGRHFYFDDEMMLYHNLYSGGKADWFDPWYHNGTGASKLRILYSSHAVWEKTAHRLYEADSGYKPIKSIYNPAWKNAPPDYSFSGQVYKRQAYQAGLFAAAIARYTRKRIARIHSNPLFGINRSIRDVATMWRGSISGLRPSIHISRDNENNPKYHQSRYFIECQIKNMAMEKVENVCAKMTITDGKNQWKKKKFYKNSSIPSTVKGSIPFEFIAKPETDYGVYMEVVGEYKGPDRQYAVSSGTFRSLKENRKDMPEVNIDVFDAFAEVLGAWEFGRREREKIGTVVLTRKRGKHNAYVIDGYGHANESYWRFEGKNKIVFLHENGQITSRFYRKDKKKWEGPFIQPKDWPNKDDVFNHYLKR